jgi:anti-anti-sigma factor
MELMKTRYDEVLVLSIAGDFDTLDVDRFSAEISEAVDSGIVRVGLHLAAMKFINSTALGALIREQKNLQQAGGDLACAELSTFADRNFKLLGLDRRIRCFDTAAEMVAWLRTVGVKGVGLEGGNRVTYSFLDDVAANENVVEMRDLHEGGLTLGVGSGEGAANELRTGRTLRLKFRLPLYHPTHEFRLTGVVGMVEEASGSVTARIAFDEVGDVERSAIAKFVEDLRFIRDELPPEGDAS